MAEGPVRYQPPGRRGGGKVERLGGAAATAIDALNREHALVMAGGDAVILQEGADAWGEAETRFLKVAAFRLLYANRLVDTGRKEPESWADLWLASPLRRQYQGVAFAPEGAPEGWYNLWRGFAVEPREGDVSRWTRHVLEVLAAGDPAHADYITGWFADIVQNPGRKSDTALVLRGAEGCGKTLPGLIVGGLLPAHYSLIDDPRYLTGQFNVHMERCLLLQADEGFWAGDKQAEGRLKGLVTSEVQYIERKGVDPYRVRNLLRLLITSNNDWAVPAGFGSRRWAVFDAAPSRIGEREYFAGLAEWGMSEEGKAALLHHLLNFDLGLVDLRRIPDTAALYEQRVATMSDEDAWWFACLRRGTVLPGHDKWETEVAREPLWESYVKFADKIGVKRKRVETQIAIAFRRRLLPEGWPKSVKTWVDIRDEHRGDVIDRRRVNAYVLPPLEECRRHFAELMSGHAIDWGGDGESPT